MRITGIILIVIGILAFTFNSLDLQKEKTLADIGPLKIEKKENKHIGWPAYAGGLTAIAGIILVITTSKKA